MLIKFSIILRDTAHPKICSVKSQIPTGVDARCNGEEGEEAAEAKVQAE